MDILILNWKDIKNPQVGGAEVIAFELAKRLVKEGNTVTFFARSFAGCLNEETIEGVKVIRRGGKLSVYIHAFLYYQQLSSKPDKVIDMINTISWFTPLYIPSKNRIAYLNQLANEVWFYEFFIPFALTGYLFERIQYLFYRNTHFLCYSESTKEDLTSFGIPPSKIHLFPIGIDQKRYYPSEKVSYPLFIFVARLVKMKRADVCIRAMRDVATVYPNAKLAIVGNGRDEKFLVRLVHKLSLQNVVVFVNKNNFFFKKTEKDAKVKLMQQAWALLLPSVKEGWGLVVTEAGACATLSIVSGVTGLRDSVIDNKTGIVLSPKPSSSELAKAIMRVIEDKNDKQKMSKAARAYATEFTWEKSFKEFYRYIKAL